MSTTLTPAQQEVVAKVSAGALRTTMTGTREGNVVRGLVVRGVLTAIVTRVPAETTYRGRYIPGAWVYSQIALAK